MKHACMLTPPKERGDVRTLLIVCVSHQARIRDSNVISLYEGLLVTKEKEKILRLTNKFILSFGNGERLIGCVLLDRVTCLTPLDHL